MSDKGSAKHAVKKPGRITALDVARGWFLIISVTTSSVLPPRPDQLLHAEWIGITLYDLIFPLFVSLSGVGMAFAYKNRVPARVTIRRIVVLTIVGLIYTGISSNSWDPSTFRLTGVLQLYAVLVLALALLHLIAKTWKAWIAVTLILATALAIFHTAWAHSCPTGVLTPDCNPSTSIDSFLFGAHMYAGGVRGHDPEGVVAILGALVTASVGTTAGHIALVFRARSGNQAPRALILWAITCGVYGALLLALVPAFKKLWTPSFSLLAGTLGILIFALAFYIFDSRASAPWQKQRTNIAHPFVALGRNSLLVYFGSHLLVAVLLRGGEESRAQILGRLLEIGDTGSLGFVLANLVLWWALALVLHRKKIYIHA